MKAESKIDQIEEAFKSHIISNAGRLMMVLNYDNDEPVAAGLMTGFYQGLYAGVNDPKVARALMEFFDTRVWPDADKNDHLGVEDIMAAVRKVIGNDA